jgi:hypothetical protein
VRAYCFRYQASYFDIPFQNFPQVLQPKLGRDTAHILLTTLAVGLIDGGETPEDAAKRELEEETGYKATGVVESSSIIVPDPGLRPILLHELSLLTR